MHRSCHSSTCPRSSFPRTRGDAPGLAVVRAGDAALPPHTRGCTRCKGPVRHGDGASPAHAGMHLSWSSTGMSISCFPRTRGDAPLGTAHLSAIQALPPHTRGCTVHGGRRIPGRRASPAHAGMHLARLGLASVLTSFPRTRGDAPEHPRHHGRRRWLPPHTRGCTLAAIRAGQREVASPAHAGMHPGSPATPWRMASFPRTRGDAPAEERAANANTSLPPHTRGCTFRIPYAPLVNPASPAHAGMHPNRLAFYEPLDRFPRTRGDAPHRRPILSARRELPPHTRGCTRIFVLLT